MNVASINSMRRVCSVPELTYVQRNLLQVNNKRSTLAKPALNYEEYNLNRCNSNNMLMPLPIEKYLYTSRYGGTQVETNSGLNTRRVGKLRNFLSSRDTPTNFKILGDKTVDTLPNIKIKPVIMSKFSSSRRESKTSQQNLTHTYIVPSAYNDTDLNQMKLDQTDTFSKCDWNGNSFGIKQI